MKLGVHMSMFCKNWDDDIIPFLEPIKDIGYDGVEVSLFGADRNNLKKVSSELKRLDLKVNCGIGISSSTDISSKDKLIRKSGINFLKECIDITKEMGSDTLSGVIAAPWQEFAENDSKQERWKRSAKSINIIAEYANDLGVNINLEVLNRFESDFMNTLNEGTEFLKLVDFKNVNLLADIFHMNIEENDILKALRENKRNIGYIHICENHRGVPGTGHIEWNDIIKEIQNNKYNGFLTLESFVASEGEVAKGLSIWRDMGNPLEEAEKAFNYIKEIINK